MNELATAIASSKMMKDIVSALINLRDHAKVVELVAEHNDLVERMQTSILAAQTAQIEMNRVISQQAEEIMQYKKKVDISEQYKIKQIAPGFFAYVENGSGVSIADAHKLCATCLDKEEKSTLQERKDVHGNPELVCFGCGATHVFGQYADGSTIAADNKSNKSVVDIF